jgi:hypothetical protein
MYTGEGKVILVRINPAQGELKLSQDGEKMPGYKKQHYVARSYLRAWSSDNRRIWMFDTCTKQSHHVGLSSVAQETYFNDAHRREGGIITDGMADNLYEEQFRVWEDQLLEVRRVAVEIAAGGRVGTLEERRVMATCVALQLLRSRQARNALFVEACSRQSSERVLTPFLPEDLQQRMAGDPEFVREHINLIHSRLLWDNGRTVPAVAAFACELSSYIWLIAQNPTPYPFYTSDAPIAAISHKPEAPPYYPTPGSFHGCYGEISLAKRFFSRHPHEGGQELIFPLAPDLALMMFHPYDFQQELTEHQGRVLLFGLESVLTRNVVIAGSAVRQVFSSTDEFYCANAALATEM